MAHKYDCFLFPCDGLRRKRQRNKRDQRDGKRKKGKEREGRAAGRFCARRGIHTVRSGSTDYVHSSLTEGTSINVAQKHGAICLGRETNRCSIARRRLTANARGRIFSWPRNPRTLFHLLLTMTIQLLLISIDFILRRRQNFATVRRQDQRTRRFMTCHCSIFA